MRARVPGVLLRTLISVTVGAVLVIAIGQAFALTRSTCDTICRPEYAGAYGIVGGLFFVVLWETTQPRRTEQDDARDQR